MKVKSDDLPNILESCSTLHKDILCKSMGLIEKMPYDGKVRLNVAEPPSEMGPETHLQKKMRLLKQSQEDMDSETYAKELTSEQNDQIMSPINDSVLRAAQDSDPFCQSVRQLIKEKKTKSERYLLVNGVLHKIIVHEGIIHSPILVPESLQRRCLMDHHLLLGHVGQKCLYGYLKRKFYWKKWTLMSRILWPVVVYANRLQ